MTEQKYKYNTINKKGKQEPWTGIFPNEKLANKWYKEVGKKQEAAGRVLVKRKAYFAEKEK